MLAGEFVKPTEAEWAFPVFLAPRKHSMIQFSVDCRKCNAVIASGSCPILGMGEGIDSLGEETMCFTAGREQWLLVSPKFQKKIERKPCFATSSINLIYLYNNWMIEDITRPILACNGLLPIYRGLKFMLVHLDDIVIISKTLEAHIRHVRSMFTLVCSAGVSTVLKKANSFSEKLTR